MSDTVADIMTDTPIHVTPEEPIKNVARLMRECDVGAVLVTEGDCDVLVGLVTDRDLVVRGLAEDRGGKTYVSEICTPAPVTLRSDDSISEAEKVMRENAVRRLPVVKNGKPVGIVSLGDLAADPSTDSALADTLADISAAPPDHPVPKHKTEHDS